MDCFMCVIRLENSGHIGILCRVAAFEQPLGQCIRSRIFRVLYSWEDNNKMDVQQTGLGDVSALIWLRIETRD
jgi:hypothetical protein